MAPTHYSVMCLHNDNKIKKKFLILTLRNLLKHRSQVQVEFTLMTSPGSLKHAL